MNDTTIKAGTNNYFWYKNHIKAVYIIEGEGEIESAEDGKISSLKPGTMYLLDKNDKHYLRAETDMRMVCAFNPPLTGKETHDDEGAYQILTD